MGQAAEKNSFRTDFILLLHLSIIALFTAGWLVFVLIMAASGERILRDGSDYFMVFIFPLIFGSFLSVIAVALSNILRQKWWIALFGTIILLGTPLIAWIITWIGKQIARFFYLATPSDLERTILVLNMKVRPRKEKEGIDQVMDPVAFVEELPFEEVVNEDPFEAVQKEVAVGSTKAKSVPPSYFGLWQTTFAALFGGVLAGGIMISLNYKNLKETSNFVIGLAISAIGQFVLMVITVGLAYSDFYLMTLIPILLAMPICVYLWQRELQNEDIENAISLRAGKRRSWWGVVVLIVLTWIFYGIFNSAAREIIWALDMPFR